MHTGWLLIICSYCCLHLNPIWSELCPRSFPNPQSSAAWLQRFPLRRFLFVSLRGLSPLSLQNDSDYLSLANLMLPQVLGKHRERGMPAAPRPAGGAPALRAEGSSAQPQLRGCISHPRAVGEGIGASPALTRTLGQYSRHSAAGSDLKVAAETPDFFKKIY